MPTDLSQPLMNSKALLDWLVPAFSKTNIKNQDGSTNTVIGPGGALGIQNIGDTYTNYINNIAVERAMTPAAKAFKNYQVNLAQTIGQRMFGMDKEEAFIAAHTKSVPSMMSFALAKERNLSDVLATIENGLEGTQLSSSLLGGKNQVNYNNKMESFITNLAYVIVNPKLSRYMGGDSVDTAKVAMFGLKNGTFNDIVNNPDFLKGNGSLTPDARKQVFSRLAALSNIGSETAKLFKVDSLEGLAKAEALYPDLWKQPGLALQDIKGLRHTGRAAGLTEEQIAPILTTSASISDDPINSAKSVILTAAASNSTAQFKIDPVGYTKALTSNIKTIQESEPMRMVSGIYGYILERNGKETADKVTKQILANPDTFTSRKKLLEVFDNAYTGGRQVADYMEAYADSDQAKKFRTDVTPTVGMLQNYSHRLNKTRKQLIEDVAKNYQIDPTSLKELEDKGQLTADTLIKRFGVDNGTYNSGMSGTGFLENRRLGLVTLKEQLNALAQKHGFDDDKHANLFVSSLSKPLSLDPNSHPSIVASDNLNRLNKNIAALHNIDRSFALRGKTGGKNGLLDAVAAGKPVNEWLKDYIGAENIGTDEIAKLHGLSSKDSFNRIESSYEDALTNWLNPKGVSLKDRNKSNALLEGKLT